jgi:RNase adaptor protein for sRNA GlmZ degradation
MEQIMNTTTDTAGRAPALPQDIPEDTDLVVLSFGFDRAPAPAGCTLVIDVRAVVARDGLGDQFEGTTGLDASTIDHVLRLPYVGRLLTHLTDTARDLLGGADRDGDPVVIAFGSADGTRRAVVLADQLAEMVTETAGYDSHTVHLDLPVATSEDENEADENEQEGA